VPFHDWYQAVEMVAGLTCGALEQSQCGLRAWSANYQNALVFYDHTIRNALPGVRRCNEDFPDYGAM
jgi:hypothetical protein